MTSEEVSLIASHPFVERFVLSIVKTIGEQKFNYIDKNAIHGDLVPKVSEHVMRASMASTSTRQPVIHEDLVPKVSEHAMQASIASTPVRKPVIHRPISYPVIPQQKVIPPPINVSKGVSVPMDGYGKINVLINDPSVSTIQCDGANKPISIIRAGQRQITKIVLNKKEIRGILDKVADDAHIPLLEGVFRATVNGFAINAVISEVIGSRFIIKKANAYGLLE